MRHARLFKKEEAQPREPLPGAFTPVRFCCSWLQDGVNPSSLHADPSRIAIFSTAGRRANGRVPAGKHATFLACFNSFPLRFHFELSRDLKRGLVKTAGGALR